MQHAASAAATLDRRPIVQIPPSWRPVLVRSSDVSTAPLAKNQKIARIVSTSQAPATTLVLSRGITRRRQSSMNPPAIAVGRLNHVALPTADPERGAQFYCDVLGFARTPRPSFSFRGAWLINRRAGVMVHLIHDESFRPRLDGPINSLRPGRRTPGGARRPVRRAGAARLQLPTGVLPRPRRQRP